MIGFIDDIIRTPKRDNKELILDYKNQINYWKLYEQTYKQNKFYKIEHDSISLNEISDFVDYIENIKYNFHYYCYEELEKNVLLDFIIKINEIEKENIFKINQEVFNFEKKNIHFLKNFLKCVDRAISISKIKNILINELDLIKHISNSLIEIINLVEISKIEVIIKINLQLDKYLEIVPESLKNLICNKVFYLSLSNKLIDCFKIDFDKMINLVQQWKTISDKIVLFNSSYTSSKISDILFSGINYKHKKEDYTNFELSKKTFYIFSLINKSTSISKLEDNNKKIIEGSYEYNFIEILNLNENFLKYLFASIYDIMKSNSNFILDFIKFQKYNPNKIDFFNYYKIYLQKRLLNGSCIEKEEIFIKELLLNFQDEEYFKFIDTIHNCIRDFKISNYINKEVKKLVVTVKNPLFKDIVFDLDKIKMSILSSVLWNNFIQPIKNSEISIPNNIKIYVNLIEKYYNKKYDNRKINISHEESYITIMLRKLMLKISLSNYYVLKFITNKNNFKTITDKDIISHISKKLTIPKDDVQNKINIMLYSQLIIHSSDGFDINLKMCNNKNKIDLTKKIQIDELKQIDNNNFCKQELIDCFLIKIVKKNEVTFEKYVYLLKFNLKNLFIPDNQMIKDRIDRMEQLGYIKYVDDKYYYIP